MGGNGVSRRNIVPWIGTESGNRWVEVDIWNGELVRETWFGFLGKGDLVFRHGSVRNFGMFLRPVSPPRSFRFRSWKLIKRDDIGAGSELRTPLKPLKPAERVR